MATGNNQNFDIMDASGHRSGVINNSDSGANSLRISADPDNSGSSTAMNFFIDGSERMRIASDGKVGIATSSPAKNLHIGASGADQVRSIKIDGTNGSSELQGVVLESDGANARFNILTAGGNGTPTNKFTIAAITGNVGIGTVTPATKLVVNEPANGTSDILTLHADSDGGGSNNGIASIKLMGNSNHAAFIKGGHTTNGKTILTFHTDDFPGSYSPQEQMRIDSVGDMMLGSTSSLGKLTISLSLIHI